LRALGFRPSLPIDEVVRNMIGDLLPYRDRIASYGQRLAPTVRWRASHTVCTESPHI